MPAQDLLNEHRSIQLFNFHQVEKEFINGQTSTPTSESTSSKANKNKAKKNATTKQHFDVANSGKNKVNCDVDIVCDIDKARKNIQSSLASKQASKEGNRNTDSQRIQALETQVTELRSVVDELSTLMKKLTSKLSGQEQVQKPAPQAKKVEPKQPTKQEKNDGDDDDDDVDLFGSDEDEEANELRQKRLDAYAAKKAKKPATIAKSSIILDVKPWDDETDMAELEKCVRSIKMDGLLWGASKLVPVSYGIKKLQIVCVIEDEKVSVEELTEKIEEFEDFVQSVDIAAFNKI